MISNQTTVNDNALRVFLCHGSEDKAVIRQVYDRLRDDGVVPWLDEKNILPGQDWDAEIRKAVRNSHAILVCLSSKSVNKEGYVQKEMRLALDLALEMPDGRIFLIPARLEECDLPYKLKSYHWVDLFAENGTDKLIKSLNMRAEQVKASLLLPAGSSAPEIKKAAPKKRKSNPKPSGNIINIHGGWSKIKETNVPVSSGTPENIVTG